MKAPGSILAGGLMAYLCAMVSILAWRVFTGDHLPPLALHLPLVVGAGIWAWVRWEKRA